ncbi:MAG: hypothetical protein SNH13_05975 [Rikenellaceae bacterium]
MKKLFSIVAMIAAVIFTGCSSDDDGNIDNGGISGGTPYSGELLGTWVFNSPGSTLPYSKTIIFNRDGSFSLRYVGDEDVYEEYGLYYVEDDIVALLYMKGIFDGTIADYVSLGFDFVNYYYVYGDNNNLIESFYVTEYGDNVVDFDSVKDMLLDSPSGDGKLYEKQ